MSSYRVAIIGLGVIGSGVLRLAGERPEVDVVAAIVRDPALDGVPAREIVGNAPEHLKLSTDAERSLAEARPDVVVVATRSTLADVLPQLRVGAAARAAIACTAEDLAYIRPDDSAEAAEIFDLAERHRVAIVPVGLNPGFVLDLWPLTLASVAHDVTSISARRVVDVSGFGPTVRSSLGIGYSAEDFDRALQSRRISGHRGFRESLRVLGEALGRPVDRTTIETRPIFADKTRVLTGGVLDAGHTSGVRQEAIGTTDGTDWIRLTMVVSVALDELGEAATDTVQIAGTVGLTATISPGVQAVPGTIGRIVNAIPSVASARPGVHTPLSLGITPPGLKLRTSG